MNARRRHALQRALGLGAGAVLAPWASSVYAQHQERRGDARQSPQHFGRLFPSLPVFGEATPPMLGALADLGRAGGLMDAKDPLSAGPIALITDPALSANNPNAAMPNGAAGNTFVGQFVDHDMTFDTSSRLGVATVPQRTPNARSPALDLDSMYGAGPVADPTLYDGTDRAKFKIESGGVFEDLPRLADSRALIADPRNDEHVVLAGLHAALLLFHNRVVDRVRAGGESDGGRVFAAAQRVVTWHYQWIVLTELLPSLVGGEMAGDVLHARRGRLYRPDAGEAFMPIEFQGAAYRFGHSLVRPSYRANLKGDRGQPFFGFIFDPRAEGQADPGDLRGGARAARRFVGWQTFFDFGDGEVKPRKLIDTRISTPLFQLPLGAIADSSTPISLPQRNLLRQLTWQMPSGQAIAQALHVPALRAGDFAELAGYGVNLERSTPLWYYVLKEAQLASGGQTLGPVGGRIVAEVLIGLMQSDRASWLHGQPQWRPTLPSRRGAGEFDMVDLLTLAGVDPKSRGQ
jgi:Animal haem peroxidase